MPCPPISFPAAGLGAALALVAPAARAQGFPAFSAVSERVIVGSEAPPGEARSVGGWAWDESGVWLKEPSKIGDSFWLPAAPNARMADGMVRARWIFGTMVDSSLLFRVDAPADAERLNGYGLSIEGNSVRFYRWDQGLPTPQGGAVTVLELRRRPGVEIVLFAVGPIFTATLYDVISLEQLATVALTDARYASGGLGWRAFREQDPGTRLTHLSVAHAAQTRGNDPTGFVGSKRVARVTPADFARLPEDLRALEVERGAEVVLLTDLDQLERVRRAGVQPVAVSAEVPWKYVDAEYRARRGQPPEPTADGFRLDASYKDDAMVADLMYAYAARFPELARVEEIGRTVEGRPLLALEISDHVAERESEPAVLLDGAHHALELASTEVVLDAIQTLLGGYGRDPVMTRFVDSLDIWCVPIVNRDGNHALMEQTLKSGRKNSRDTNGDGRADPFDGVDLNRNYPFRWGALGEEGSRSWPEHHRYRGAAPGSEPETAAMMALARRERPVAAITYHTNGTAILSPYTIDGVKNPVNDEAWPVAEEVAAAAPRQVNGRSYAVRRKLYSVDGASADWLRAELGTLALLVEGPLHNPREPERRRLAIEGSRPTWIALLQRFLSGPSVTGRVLDSSGAPVEAEVRIAEILPQEGERWTSRPRDGRYARFLPASGAYTVRVEAPGFLPARRRLEIQGFAGGVDFALRPAPTPAEATPTSDAAH